ncbi:hypothetical protein CKO31_16935 [Thiohalocapsa halophila]|uniref:Transposase IS4-like domain-containing protein n=1 Tax=Thiohalocapsa halophila TaxID=69359 RepID=A0ABS1CKD5_9GAMM|nr:transposase [Thiohalocapsa halophila]MBK1632392.1 hypothetical protein [Thiohalocapsa halophila]
MPAGPRSTARVTFGHKTHINVNAEHKLIRDYEATAARFHDSQVFDGILDSGNDADPQVWADSAYRSEETEGALSGAGYESHICEQGQSNQPLSGEQQAALRSPLEAGQTTPIADHTHPHTLSTMLNTMNPLIAALLWGSFGRPRDGAPSLQPLWDGLAQMSYFIDATDLTHCMPATSQRSAQQKSLNLD